MIFRNRRILSAGSGVFIDGKSSVWPTLLLSSTACMWRDVHVGCSGLFPSTKSLTWQLIMVIM